jgi:hypothetical protein
MVDNSSDNNILSWIEKEVKKLGLIWEEERSALMIVKPKRKRCRRQTQHHQPKRILDDDKREFFIRVIKDNRARIISVFTNITPTPIDLTKFRKEENDRGWEFIHEEDYLVGTYGSLEPAKKGTGFNLVFHGISLTNSLMSLRRGDPLTFPNREDLIIAYEQLEEMLQLEERWLVHQKTTTASPQTDNH